jgi:uncharacterized ubiquitin-like protein YukD
MHVQVKLSDGKTFKVDVDENSRVKDIKKKLKSEHKQETKKFQLKYNGKVLKPRDKLNDHGIKDNDVLELDTSKKHSDTSSSSDTD